jgi:hypothetical protein
MSREIGSDQTTKQRLVHTACSFSASPPTACQCIKACMLVAWLSGTGQVQALLLVGRRCVRRPRPRSMLTMPPCRPHKGTCSPMPSVTRHSWPHRSPWRCMMRVAAAGCKRHREQFPR